MANIKITELPSAGALAGTELLELAQTGSSVSATAAAIGNSATALPYLSLAGRAYGSFCDITTSQTGSTTVATAVRFNTNVMNSNGITMAVDGSSVANRLTFAVAGTYMIAPNLQLANSNAADMDITIWLAKSGTNIAYSATKITVPKVGDGGTAFFQLVFYETVTAGQYIEILWLPENVNVTLAYTAANAGPPSIPAVPSAIVVAERIA